MFASLWKINDETRIKDRQGKRHKDTRNGQHRQRETGGGALSGSSSQIDILENNMIQHSSSGIKLTCLFYNILILLSLPWLP